MRTPVIAGNWKMHKNGAEAKEFATDFYPRVRDVQEVEIILAPPYTSIPSLVGELEGTNIKVAAQNMHFADKGAYTGEISPSMLLEQKVTHVIIGHSERRQYYAETDESVNLKVKGAISIGLVPIFCVGETLEEREKGEMKNVIRIQVEEGLRGVGSDDPSRLIIAYEPVWAIGTGKTASPDQAQEVHHFIRELLGAFMGAHNSAMIRILYGGSVKPGNIKSLMGKEDIDGGLVGGASLDPSSFEEIVKFYE